MEEENKTKEEKYYCQICKGELKGDPNIKYYCKNCNLLFSKKSVLTKKEKEQKKKD